MRALLVLLVCGATAWADRPLHASLGAGGTLVMTGAEDDHLRFDAQVSVSPYSRYGALLAWRGFDADHRGLVTAGLTYEGAAARPRLVVQLHADAGADLDHTAPLFGGGIRTTLTIIGPLAIVLDTAAFLVVNGVDDTRLQLQSNALVSASW